MAFAEYWSLNKNQSIIKNECMIQYHMYDIPKTALYGIVMVMVVVVKNLEIASQPM